MAEIAHRPVSGVQRSSVRVPGVRAFAFFALALGLCYAKPLFDLARFAWNSSLFSHILLVPFVSGYLIWLKRRELGAWWVGNAGTAPNRPSRHPSTLECADSPALFRGETCPTGPDNRSPGDKAAALGHAPETSPPHAADPLDCAPANGAPASLPIAGSLRHSRWSSVVPAAISFAAGLALLAIYWLLRARGWRPVLEDYLSLVTLSFYGLLLGGGFFFLGRDVMRKIAFPAGFLIFIVPLPVAVIDGLEVFFQHTSADATSAMMLLTGTPFVRDGLVFQLPGITIKVAQECSGIHSSLVLFVTGLLAGHLFLRAWWKKALLAALVVPLGILRNGFRIVTISMLCVHVDPNMINSPIHRQGGPLFFALSLIPFFLLLLYLRRTERRLRAAETNVLDA